MIVPDDRKVSILLYGDPAVGKTTLLGTGVGDDRIGDLFVMDSEGTTLPLRRMEGVSIAQVRSFDDINRRLDELEKTASSNPYRTIVLDTLTAMSVKALIDLIEKGNDVKGEKSKMLDQAEQADYLKSFNQLRPLIKRIQDAPYNSIFLAHTRVRSVGPTNKYEPSLQGKAFVGEVIGMMNEVWSLQKDVSTGERVLLLNNDDPSTRNFSLKAQTINGVEVPSMLENPTLPAIWDLFQF